MGLVYIFTGDGKGKTEASIGAVIRAIGHGKDVSFIQFMKGLPTGEIEPLKKLGVHVYRFGRKEFVDPRNPSQEDFELARKGIEKAKEEIGKGRFLVVLDEINVAIAMGLVNLDDVLNLIDSAQDKTNIILTGRYAKRELIERADLVTEMKEIKHYFKKGVQAKEGIDY